MIYKSDKIYTEDGVIDGYLVVEDGIVQAIYPSSQKFQENVDYTGYTILPGIFDTHNHGTMGYQMMERPQDPMKELQGYVKALAAQGVTAIFPTAGEGLFADIAAFTKNEYEGARILGIHSEGPYLNRVGEKGVDLGHPDIDLTHVEEMIEHGKGLLKLVGMAPELPGSAQATQLLLDHGIKVAFTHSNCNYHEAMAAFDRGVSVATHTANVMSGIHHREMGGLGACLLHDNVACEIICDGLHVSLEMLELMFRVKPYEQFMMISDSTPMAGAPCGSYKMGIFQTVNITEDGFCLTDTGRLCGSSKSVLFGMKNLVEKLHIPLETVWRMASLNPAKVYGFDDRKGSIQIGKDADFIVVKPDFALHYTYCEGKKVFDYQTSGDLFNQAFLEENLIRHA